MYLEITKLELLTVYGFHGLVYFVLLILSEGCYVMPYLFLVFDGCRNQEFQQSVKELKEKADELKGVKEELKER